MNLAARRSARQRENFVMRLGCVLVSAALLASLVLEPPKAKAFAVTSAAVTALAGGFLSACGLAPVVSGMSSSGDVNESLARLIQDYLTAEHPGVDMLSWLGDMSLLRAKNGSLIIPLAMTTALGQFAIWVAGKYGTKPGENQVFNGDFVSFDGGSMQLTTISGVDMSKLASVNSPQFFSDFTLGTPIQVADSKESPIIYQFLGGYGLGVAYFYSEGDNKFLYHLAGMTAPNFRIAWGNVSDSAHFSYPTFAAVGGYLTIAYVDDSDGRLCVGRFAGNWVVPLKYVVQNEIDLSLDVSDTMQEVLDRLTALEEGQSIALDVGATAAMSIQDILQDILDKILAGDLAASAEVVDEAVEPVEPDPPVVPVLPSGLDKLGAALTSRFPFSIPWDVYKGVKLLAAPAKAPYFEVDFLAPIADRVGGWQGSTKIVLDFSEYEIIGQVCRWTSTIGFCLMLASGTKRLIWTA